MRIWSFHPKYLDSKGLVALWREALLARKVLEGKTKGYRNHSVVSGGPYKYIRHPGYLGIILAVTGIPFILGSAYGFIATGFCILIMIIRTYLEDNVLKEKLSGYKEYSNRVKYRLCYGIF